MRKIAVLSLWFAVLVYSASVDSGLILYYPFNGTAEDSSGYGRHGAVYGPTPCENRFNKLSAFSFDGVDDYVDGGAINFSLPITVSLWFKSTSPNEVWNTLFGWNDPAVTGPDCEGVQIYTDGEGRLGIRLGNRSDDLKNSSTIVGDGAWHHVVIMRDLANHVWGYIDGALEVSSSAYSDLGSNHQLYIGRSFQPPSYVEFFFGALDDVRVYNRVLSEAEVRRLFLSSDEAYFQVDNNTIALWRFNELSGDSAYDEGPYRANGYLRPGVERRAGLYGGAVYSDAPSECIQIPNLRQLEDVRQFKIEAWVNIPVYNSSVASPILHIGQLDTFAVSLLICGRHKALDFLTYGSGVFGDGQRHELEYPLSDGHFGRWIKVGAEIDDSLRKIYLNDTLVAWRRESRILFPPNYWTIIGSDTWFSPAWHLDGLVDELKVSAVLGVIRPQITAPDEMSEIHASDSLAWTGQGNPPSTVYQIQISTRQYFQTINASQSVSGARGIRIAQLADLPSLPLFTHLFWRVRAACGKDTSDWSPTASFFLLDNSSAGNSKAEGALAGKNLIVSPNPFNSKTSIRLHNRAAGFVILEIVDLNGRQVARLVKGFLPRGTFFFSWKPAPGLSAPKAAGIYLARLKASGRTSTLRLVLLK